MTIADFLPLKQEMKSMAFHMGATDSNSDDIVQDVFLQLLEFEREEGDLSRFEYKGQPNKAYIYMMIRSRLGDVYRDLKKRQKEEAAFIHNMYIRQTMEEVEEQHELESDMKDALNSLHFFSRMVFEAYVLDNHSFRSLSDATNIGVQTLRTEVKYVKEKLKSKL